MNIQIALKLRSYILDLDHMKSSLGIFFFLSCLMESLLYQLPGSTLIFVNNTHQKFANLMFCLILPVAKGSIQCCELYCTFFRYFFETFGHSVSLYASGFVKFRFDFRIRSPHSADPNKSSSSLKANL